MTNIRAFIAVELPGGLKLETDKLLASLKPIGAGVRWAKPINLHLTLRFLGNIEQDKIPLLENKLKDNLAGFKPFAIQFSGLGCFPNLQRPRIVWSGVGGNLERLKELASAVEAACRQSGFGKRDKHFSAHLTIGRIKHQKKIKPLVEYLKKAEFKTDKFQVNEIVIFRSDLSPNGPNHTPLVKIKLSRKYSVGVGNC